jgi:hypothetical protein
MRKLREAAAIRLKAAAACGKAEDKSGYQASGMPQAVGAPLLASFARSGISLSPAHLHQNQKADPMIGLP